MASLQELQRQRTLDRCVFRVLKSRCETLNRLADTNQILRGLVRTLALAQAGKTAGSLIPVVGQVIAVVGEAPLAVLRTTARGLAHYQDGIIQVQKVVDLTAMRCGVPLGQGNALSTFTRPFSIEAAWAGAPSPLEWEEGPPSSEIDVTSWNLQTRSFGYCHTREPGQSLDGEDYEVRFQHPARPVLRSSSFSP